jgi:hypothetical protein
MVSSSDFIAAPMQASVQALAHALERRGAHARRVRGHQEERQATWPGTPGAGRDKDDLGDITEGDAGLLTVEDEMIAVADRLGADVTGVGAAAGFGEGERHHLALGDARDPFVAQLRRHGVRHFAEMDSVADDVADLVIAAADLLADYAAIDKRRALAAIFLRQAQVQQAGIDQLVDVGLRQPLSRAVPALVVRKQLGFGIAANRLPDHLLFFCKAEFHGFALSFVCFKRRFHAAR